VRFGNVPNIIRQGRIIAIAVNSAEYPIDFLPPKLEDIILFEKFLEATTRCVERLGLLTQNGSRMKRIREAIQTKHLNREEMDSLWKVCQHFADLFQLDGDRFPTTNAIQYNIRLK